MLRSICQVKMNRYVYRIVLSSSKENNPWHWVAEKNKNNNVQIIKRKYIMTNINTQETDYSVYDNALMCINSGIW